MQLFIIMGVSGTGKSTIAQHLAKELSFEFVEADDFHSVQAKEQMAANKPLDDEMRKPWINSITRKLSSLYTQGNNVVLAYSGLKYPHRNRFRTLDFTCHFIYLTADVNIIAERMNKRSEHFFSTELLSSQFIDMELPQKVETDLTTVDVAGSLHEVKQYVFELALKKINKEYQ